MIASSISWGEHELSGSSLTLIAGFRRPDFYMGLMQAVGQLDDEIPPVPVPQLGL